MKPLIIKLNSEQWLFNCDTFFRLLIHEENFTVTRNGDIYSQASTNFEVRKKVLFAKADVRLIWIKHFQCRKLNLHK